MSGSQELRVGDIEVAVISEDEYHRTLILAARTQKVRVGNIGVLVTYPPGSTIEEIERLIEAAKGART